MTTKTECDPRPTAENQDWPTVEAMQWREWEADPHLIQQTHEAIEDVALKAAPQEWRSGTRGSVVVLGCGAVGGVALEKLARIGLRQVIGVDPDEYGRESFLTQPAGWNQNGRRKAWVQGARAHAANPTVRVRMAVGYGQDLPLDVLRQADVFAVAGDNLDILIWAAGMAVAFGKPLVQGAVHGETGTAIVRGYALQDSEATCPRCSLGQRELQQQESRHGCDPFTMRRTGTTPTRTLPPVCAVAGNWVAMEVFKWVAGLGHQALCGEEYAQSLLTYRGWRSVLPRNPNCPHRRWELRDAPGHGSQTTLAMLAAELGHVGFPKLLQVRAEVPWISYTFCAGCGRRVKVRRFARLGTSVGCCQCGAPLQAGPQGSYSTLPDDDLRQCWEQPLTALGLDDDTAVGLQHDQQWAYFFPVKTNPTIEP